MSKIHTVITGHGNFATGLRSSIKLLAGVPETFDFVDFTEDMSEEDMMERLSTLNQNGDAILYFADLLGGTPYKCAAKIAFDNSEQDVAVVAGCNLGALLETMFDDYHDAKTYADALVDATKASVQVLDLTPDVQDNVEEDGI